MTSKVWTELRCNGSIPAARSSHAVALVGDMIYMFGGELEDRTDLADMWCFKISGGYMLSLTRLKRRTNLMGAVGRTKMVPTS